MRRRINEEWMKKAREEMDEYNNRGIVPTPQIFTWNTSCQWYIRKLVEKEIPYHIIQRGAGVKEVVIKKKRCECCRGKGYIEEEQCP